MAFEKSCPTNEIISNVTRIKQLVIIFLRSDLCNKIQIIEKFLHVTGASVF